MKSQDLRRLGIVYIVSLVCLLQFGCQKQAAPPVTEKRLETPQVKEPTPKIEFETIVCDLGDIRPASKNICDFKFTNVGDGVLKITDISKTCGCTPFSLKKTEYAPGESGLLQVSYNASNRSGPTTKYLKVFTNDNANPQIQLTIKGRITEMVSYEPKRLELLLNKENAGCPDIILKGLGEKPFSIKGFKTTGRFQSTEDCITADFDPRVTATEFVIKPKVDMAKLHRRTSGTVTITVAHPENQVISIPFKILPKFKVEPHSITVFDAKAGKSVVREVWIVNNYNEDFEIESTSSEKGAMKVLNQEKKDNHYKLGLEITPPTAEGGERVFTDVLYVNIKNGEKLQISCHGYYAKEALSSSK